MELCPIDSSALEWNRECHDGDSECECCSGYICPKDGCGYTFFYSCQGKVWKMSRDGNTYSHGAGWIWPDEPGYMKPVLIDAATPQEEAAQERW